MAAVVGGNTNPVGPQQEDAGQGSSMATPTQLSADGDGRLHACIGSSPDEHEPLLRTNNNNNNNSNNNNSSLSAAGTHARPLTHTRGLSSTHTDAAAPVHMRPQSRSRRADRPI